MTKQIILLYNKPVDVIIDASCVVSILLAEHEAKEIRKKTSNIQLISSSCLPYEVGNSLTSALKRRRITANIIDKIFREFKKMPIRLVETNIETALRIAADENHYAYDAYYIACAIDKNLPILSLDNGLIEIARKRGIKCL